LQQSPFHEGQQKFTRSSVALPAIPGDRPSAAAETKDIKQLTGGVWQDLFKGSCGCVAVGPRGSHTVRQAFDGVGGAPRTDEGGVMTSFRYNPFRTARAFRAGEIGVFAEGY
jgi:hypothetical protein